MPQHNASEAQFWFEVGGEPADTFQLLEFGGAETISQPFRYELKLIAPIEADLSLQDFLNTPAKFIFLRDDKKKEVHGILCEFEEVGRFVKDRKTFAQYLGVFVPRLWTLSLFYQSRVFQNKSVPEIITEVLQGAGLGSQDFKIQLKRSPLKREYCAQYRETDLNFISRLMEYEGMYYFFDHADGKDVLVIVDDNEKDPDIDSPSVIDSNDYGIPDEEFVSGLIVRQRVVTGKVMLKDYNYRTPETNLSVESQLDSENPGLYYEYGEHFKNTAEGKILAKTRNEEIEAQSRVLVGVSDCRGFHAGFKFTLRGHYRNRLNGSYLITQVGHTGGQSGGIGYRDGAGKVVEEGGPTYSNSFTCIPVVYQYRPPRITPEPKIPGIMTAKVETAGGDYAYLDEEGRYRVKMPFDISGAGQGKASRAIRLAQPYTGSGYGMHFPVHAGTELVWACVDGNIDRPLGLSSVSNPSRNSPVAAQNKSQNVVRTAGGNEMVMEDLKGQSSISFKTTDAHNIILDDKDDKIDVITTMKHKVTMDDKNKNITVQTTDGHLLIMDDKNTKITVQSKNGHRMSISDKDGAENITLVDKNEKNTFIIDITNNKLVIKTDDGSIDFHAPNGTIDIKATTLKVETTSDTSFKAANMKVEAQVDYGVKATNIKQEAQMDYEEKGMNVKSEASMEHKTSGLNVTSEAGVNQQVKGTMVTVQSTGPNTIKGMPVMIN